MGLLIDVSYIYLLNGLSISSVCSIRPYSAERIILLTSALPIMFHSTSKILHINYLIVKGGLPGGILKDYGDVAVYSLYQTIDFLT